MALGSTRARTVLAASAALVLAAVVAAVVIVARLPGTPSAAPSSSASAVPDPTTTAPASPSSAPPSPASPPSPSSPSSPSASPQSQAERILASMSLEQRVGQVMMVSSPAAGPNPATLDALRRLHIGNVFLKGMTTAGAASVAGGVGQVRAEATADATLGVGQFVATDQEGGQVQILRGPGFSTMPSALAQGSMDPSALRAAAGQWGKELASVGVDVNFAPVLDTVPSSEFAPSNIPIGHFEREFGFTPDAVAAHGVAFAQGMADSGVAATPKHFPGLGRVTANTDTSTDVADSAMTRSDAYLAPFAKAVEAGVSWMMVSNALYPAIDPDNNAVFSPTVIQGMLRRDLGFRGIIVSDDVCDAAQLSGFLPEHRGSNFLAAGGTMVLCTDQALAPRVWQGIVDRATSDPAFARAVDAAALAVLEAKGKAGLLPR
ncbi:glycoside hydrolase family 3 N-terminal domain-containing protein [Sinomonas sp. ASV322]|uniref:glycoside hydrolase family 3 N-terminal domain-containing protein n=1 Tax=Sinomonas sp. ASV322 TaxID=3041920 RepID=UPI0027DD33AC|nr:glycoside hydrolase family 3 N-terminal domain-containing protein [Sinomonas sp. ASV322]MDQ4503220.1 glycoside hydrolase family 3 N-terminal domain-containing protein [Sinomonas sp. ASV322]